MEQTQIVEQNDFGFLKKVKGLYSYIYWFIKSFSLVNFRKDNYLLHERAFSIRKHRLISYIILFTWFILVLFLAIHHEIWRDEMRAYVIADKANSIFDIPELLINDGHPPLWHFLLYFVNYFVGTPLTLQIAAISISVISVFLFFRYSSFNNIFKILFIFGIIPFYEYTIFSRNYGISMLLMITATILLTQKKYNPLWFYVIISLLVLTNFHSILISVIFVIIYFIFQKQKNNTHWMYHIIGLLILLTISIFSISIVLPNEDSIYSSEIPGLTTLVKEGIRQIVFLGEGFKSIFFGYHPILKTIMFWIVALGLIRKPILFFAYIIVAAGLGVFFNIGYQPYLRHEGLFYIFAVMLYWISYANNTNGLHVFRPISNKYFFMGSKIIFGLLLLLQFKYGIEASIAEVKYPVSSSKQFAQFINANDQFENAIIIGDMDVVLESIPYYIDNKIYFSRENRFGKRVNLTNVRDSVISFKKLIDDAYYLHNTIIQDSSSVLILLSYDLKNIKMPLNENEKLAEGFKNIGFETFMNHTTLIKTFRGSLTGEDYDVYLFTPNKQDSNGGFIE